MMQPNDHSRPAAANGTGFPGVKTILLASAAGALGAAALLPAALPGLAASLTGSQPQAYWFLARSSAWTAYLLLWLSMVMGLSMTTKIARLWPGAPAANDLHQFVSLLGIAFALFHGLILTGDRYIQLSAWQVFLPFASFDYRPLWVGIGQFGFYAMALVAVSFYVRRKITPRIWRLIHYLSFLTFLFVFVHGITSGTDSTRLWAAFLYLFTGGTVFFMTTYRILSAVLTKMLDWLRTGGERREPGEKSLARS